MATLTAEQIEQKKQQLKQLAEEAQQLKNELVEAGAWPLDEDDLDQAAGGGYYNSKGELITGHRDYTPPKETIVPGRYSSRGYDETGNIL